MHMHDGSGAPLVLTLLALTTLLAVLAVIGTPCTYTFSGPVPPVLAISLRKAGSRRDRLTAQAPCVEYVLAVDGSTLPGGHERLTRGEQGCFLSHVRVWNRIASSSAEYTVVLEDDADITLPQQWPAIMRSIASLPRDWDLLFLGVNNPKSDSQHVAPGVRVLEQDAYGTHAVVVRRSAALKLLRRFESVGMREAPNGKFLPLDIWVSRLPLRMYWLEPALVRPFDTTDSDTIRMT